jgi:hypothetical protein
LVSIMTVEPSSRASDRRNGRRWLRISIRLLAWMLAGLAGLMLAAGLLVESRWLQEMAREKAIESASAALGREVTIKDLELGLFPPAAEASGVLIAGDTGESEPLARVERLRVRVGPGVLGVLLGTGTLVLAEIDVVRPEVTVVSYEDGTTSLPVLEEPEGGEGGELAIRIGTLHLTDGLARLDERSVPLSLSASGLAAVLQGSEEGAHALTASSELIRLQMPEGELEAELLVQALFSEAGVTIRQARLQGDRLVAEGTGRYDGESLAAELRVAADLAVLESLGVGGTVTGQVEVTGELEAGAEGWMFDGQVAAEGVGVDGVQIGSANVDVSGSNERIEIEIRQTALAGGRVKGSATVTPPVPDGSVRASFVVDEVDLPTLLALLGGVEHDLTGLLSGEVAVQFPLDRPLEGSGRAALEVASRAGAIEVDEGTPPHPIDGALNLTFEGGVLTLESGRLDGFGQQVAMSGRAQLGDEVDLSLIFEGVDLGAVLRLANSPVVGLEGRVSGDVAYRFAVDEPTLGTGRATVRVDASERTVEIDPGSWSVPVEGSASVGVSGGVLEIEEVALTSPRQRISLTGTADLSGPSASLDFDLWTEDPRALLHALPVIYEADPEPLWEPSAGKGSLAGSVQVDPAGFRTRLELELESAVVTGSPVARVAGELEIDSAGLQEIDLELRRSDGSVSVRGAVPFPEPPPGFQSPDFYLLLDIDSWSLGDAEPWLGFELPGEGIATAHIELGGSIEALEGSLDGRVEDLSVEGLEFEGELLGALTFDPEALLLEEARLVVPAGEIRGEGVYETLADELDLELTSSALDLAAAPFSDWLEGSLSGTVEVGMRVAGSSASPSLTARIVGSDLALGDQVLGDQGSSEIELGWQAGELEVAGSLIGLLTVEGGGELTADSADLDIRLASDALADFVELATGDVPEEFSGSFAGSLLVRRAEGLNLAEIRINALDLSMLGSRLANIEPVVVRFADGGARIESLYLQEEGTGSELFVVGSLGSAESELDLKMVSSIDIAWLGFFLEGIELSGRGDVLAVVRGTLDAPLLDGQAELSDGRMIIGGFPHAIEQIRGFLFLYPNRAVIDSGKARFAGGELLAEGEIALGENEEQGYELRFAASDVDIRYPEDWLFRGDAQLVLSETPDDRLLGGTVELESAAFVKDFQLGFTQLVRTLFQRRPEFVEETDEVLVGTRRT